MIEETDAPESGPAPDTGGVAIDLAMEEARNDPSLRGHVADFLDDQRRLIADQRHHLHEQFKQLRLGLWEKRIGVYLRLATLVMGLAVAALLGMVVWTAATSDGLIVNEFSVSPDLAQRGLTGQVIAGQVLGSLSDLQARSVSVRIPSSYANNWGNDLKVEIPETGVSISELNRFLRDLIGNETHINGAVYRTATGIAVAARVGGDAVPTVTGTEAELDALLQQTAEAIYSRTQPYRYGLHFYTTGRRPQAKTALNALVATGPAQERFWAYNGLNSIYATENDWQAVAQVAKGALAVRPNSFVPNFFWARTAFFAQYDETALAAAQAALAADRDPDISKPNWAAMRLATECVAASLQGDFRGSSELCRQALQLPNVVSNYPTAQLIRLLNAAALHDSASVRSVLAETAADSQGATLLAANETLSDLLLGRWSALARQASLHGPAVTNSNMYAIYANARAVQPVIAYATAQAGDLKGAHALIDRTPLDCSPCLRTRGRIAALEKNWNGAAAWFARAAQVAPSTPFAFSEWGQMLLAKGDADAAIAQFNIAHRQGPKFADPLEFWGEALMAKNQSHLALAKFVEAEKYAPNWGRLHLKWGEALAYTGKAGEAKKQFDRAAQLDLPPREKSELTRVSP
jgi:tetratricopeptide (TPR) repeat protein